MLLGWWDTAGANSQGSSGGAPWGGWKQVAQSAFDKEAL